METTRTKDYVSGVPHLTGCLLDRYTSSRPRVLSSNLTLPPASLTVTTSLLAGGVSRRSEIYQPWVNLLPVYLLPVL